VPRRDPEARREYQRAYRKTPEGRKARKASEKRREIKTGYKCWQAMKRRCDDPRQWNYDSYGGRGIDYDPRWKSFSVFRQDMGPRPSPKHSLDRIDNDKGYWPGNVRWATPLQQALNRRSKKIEVTRGDYGDPWSDTLADQCAA
jgi:hypothetical protein